MKALGQCPHHSAQPSKHHLPYWQCGYSTENPKNMNSFSPAPSSILAPQACRKTSLSLKCLFFLRQCEMSVWENMAHGHWQCLVRQVKVFARKVPHQNLYFSKFYTNSLGLKLDCDCFLQLGLSRSLFYFSENFFPLSALWLHVFHCDEKFYSCEFYSWMPQAL